MEEIETQARLVDFNPSSFVTRGLSTVVSRDEIAEAIRHGEYPARLMLDVERGDDVTAHARVAVEWDEATLGDLLRSTSEDDVVLWFDPDELERALESDEVDAHGLREKTALLAIAVAAAGGTAGAALANYGHPAGGATVNDGISRYEANMAAANRFQAAVAGPQSDGVSRYLANSAADATPVDGGALGSEATGDGTSSAAVEAAAAIGAAMLITGAGFVAARGQRRPERPA